MNVVPRAQLGRSSPPRPVCAGMLLCKCCGVTACSQIKYIQQIDEESDLMPDDVLNLVAFSLYSVHRKILEACSTNEC